MASGKRTIRASEIGTFLYCQRAWWYQRNKVPTINTAELAGGQAFHRTHVGQTRSARWLKAIAWMMLVFALLALILLMLG